MKIGYDAKRFFHNSSGLGNYSRDLIRILAGYYPDNEYILFSKSRSSRGKDILEKDNVHFSQISKGQFSRQTKMGIDAQDKDCDIFHGLSGELPLKWNKKPIKKVVTIHDVIFLVYPEFYSFFDREIHRWKFSNACKNADVVVAISEQTKKDIIKYFKVPQEKIKVVYQTCHDSFRKEYSQEEILQIKEKYNLPDQFLFNVGTIEERKNVLAIVKAIKGSEIPLVLVGRETKYSKKIRSFIERNKMENQVIFISVKDMKELAIIYGLATIFVYPSLYEGFGIPIIEALYRKTPVIASNLSCMPEAAGPDSLYINPTDIDDIRAKIHFLWSNQAERIRRAEKSFAFVQRFNDDKIASDLMNVYKNLL